MNFSWHALFASSESWSRYLPTYGDLSKQIAQSSTATMSVLLETSLGDIVIDLQVDYAPKCCEK